MDLKVIISVGLVAILGFLLYPRSSGQKVPMVGYESEWISTQEILEDEPLHGAKLRKDNPAVQTYDLGFIYKVDRAAIRFSEAPESYDVLASTVRDAQKYDRLTSKDEYYPVINLLYTEARWIQVVANDWKRTRPKIESTRISARHSRHTPVNSVRTSYNRGDAFRLIDGLKKGNAPKWIGGKRVEKEVEKDGKKVKEVTYESPGNSDVEVTFDLGIARRIYGVAVTTGGDENNLRQYAISIGADRRSFQQVYTSAELENKTLTDTHIFTDALQARYVRLQVESGNWYGKYPEIKEVEIYTDGYRLSNYDEQIQDHNASQVYHDNCGMAGNAQAPNVTQGFPFYRGQDAKPEHQYFLKPNEEVDAKNSSIERSFCYHYDRIILKYPPHLDPENLYWVQVTYLQEKDGKRIQSLDVDGFLLHDDMAIPTNEAQKYTYAIPPAAYADGEIELHFNRLTGPNAVVSEVLLFGASKSGAPIARVDDRAMAIASAPMIKTPIVIDGILDEWPGIYPLIPQQYKADPQGAPGEMFVQWDNDNLYLALKVNRSKLNLSTPAQSSDTLHVFMDAALERSPGMYGQGDHHFRFLRLGVPASEKKVLVSQIHHHKDAIPKTIMDSKDIEVAATLASGARRYTLEARIPRDKALHRFLPQAGGVIGFNYILGNSSLETGSARDRRSRGYPLSWAAPEVNAPPISWGRLELVGTISGQPAIMDQSLANSLTSFRAGDTLVLTVRDPDRNTDRNSPQSIKVRISGELTKDSKEIVLHETTQAFPQTADNSDLFAGSILTEFSLTPSKELSTLAVQGEELVTLEYLDPYYGPDQSDVPVSYTATVEVGTDGIVQIVSESGEAIENFNAGDRLFFRVEDGDLAKDQPPTAQIPLTIRGAADKEEITLVDEGNTGVFTGSIETVYSREDAADGILQVEGYDVAKLTYLDLIQSTGNTKVPVEAEAVVNIGSTGLLSVGGPSSGNIDDFMNKENFNAAQNLMILLQDADINVDKTATEQVDVRIEGNIAQDSVVLTVIETAPDSGIFSGVLSTAYSDPEQEIDSSNKTLEIMGNETVTVIYNDALQATGATNARVTRTVVVNVGNDGAISILKSNYFLELDRFNAGERLYFRVDDADLNLDSRVRDMVEISVNSGETLDGETAILREMVPDSGVFFGSLGTEYAVKAASDNILQVQGNEIVTAIYLDELLSTGETSVSVIDTCRVNVGTTGKVTIYNKVNPYTPLAGFPDEGWEGTFRAGDTLVIRLEDDDLNLASAAAEIFQISTTEDVIRDSESIILTEASGSAGIFVGEIKTEYGTEAITGDDVLQVQGEGRVNISYGDAITSTGETDVRIPVSLTVETGEIGGLQAISSATREPISSFSAGDEFIVQVKDGDLNANPSAIDQATVIIRGNLLEDELQIVLQETELDTGVFAGLVQSIYSTQSDLYDTALQVEEKEVLFLTYIDEVGVTGEASVPISVELVVRSGIAGYLVITDDSGRELPNLNAGQKLYFRLDDFVLSNTSPNTPARIRVQGDKTKDSEEVLLEEKPGEQGIYTGSIPTSYGNTPIQDGILQVRGGEEVSAIYKPRTPGTPPDPIVDITYTNEGSTGKITISGANGLKLTNFNAGDTLYIKLEDFDLNLNTFAVDTSDIWISGDAIAGGKTITLTETSEDSGIFTDSIDTRYGRGVFESRSILEVVGGEEVTAVYNDALTNLGETDVRVVDSCRANMLGTAPFVSRGVTIDGSLGEWPLENALRAGDEGSNVYIQWDRDNLYILAYVMDTDVVVPDATQFWDGADALEIHIDTDPNTEISSYLRDLKKPSYHFFWFCPKGAGPDGNKPYVGQSRPETIYNYTEIDTSVKIFPGSRYVLEARIPFDSALGGFDPYKTSKADRVGFNYIVRRSNAPQLRWAAGAEGEPNLPPSFFGTLILKQPQQ